MNDTRTTLLKLQRRMLVHALEKSVKIRTVFEAALDKHFFDGVVRVS